MNNESILVTGGAGFIGSNFVHYWLNKYPNHKVVVIDSLTYAGNLPNLEGCEKNANYHFIEANICDYEVVSALLKEHEIVTIVNFAAESHVDRSISDPDAFIHTNIYGTYTLLKAAKNYWLDGEESLAHRFHHISTDEVYGTLTATDNSFTEATAYAPNSPYSASKASADHLVRAYQHTYGLSTTVSNCSNNYGPFHFPEKLIPLVITNILFDKPLPIYGDGKQIRDWLYVNDHAIGIDLILHSGEEGHVYNIGGNNEWTNIDIVQVICATLNQRFKENKHLHDTFPTAKSAIHGTSETLITYVTDRLGHDRRYAVDASKINNELGYQPQQTFESGIEKTIEWYLNNQEWWMPLIAPTHRSK